MCTNFILVFNFPLSANHIKSLILGGMWPLQIFFQFEVCEFTNGDNLSSSHVSDFTKKVSSLENAHEKESILSIDRHTESRITWRFFHSSTSRSLRFRHHVRFQIHDECSQSPHDEILACGLEAIKRRRGKRELREESPTHWSSQNRVSWPFPTRLLMFICNIILVAGFFRIIAHMFFHGPPCEGVVRLWWRKIGWYPYLSEIILCNKVWDSCKYLHNHLSKKERLRWRRLP